ncbi:histidine kinase N-terminal 7TM domain-containing diguanylate cyclase [Paenibacillus sp. MMS18-CY102]|uniref:histidine kinase N-terminal 7TM domain-containing diguanylate cyclase n=1 Tax=Paenibacillus sp. MMS18-CY102 TaxID=2682849 RepID=UPI0013660ED3|nr:histidine kinase N-terminal 7TM domain-containing protein [Paenibacillus sp. MMS18-CY102]MWC29753.1 diguanylate cyclase [Paenibacillus sp. MMS18-CY102]
MGSQIATYITLVGISGVFNLFLCFYVFTRRRESAASRTFILYTLALSIYCFGYTFELGSSTLEQVRSYIMIEYIGICTFSPLALILVLQYLGRRISRIATVALFIIPAITWIMVSTSRYHHMYYRVFKFEEGVTPHVLMIEMGQWYILHDFYMIICTVASIALLLSRWKQTGRAFRRELAILMGGLLVPMIAGIAYRLGLTPTGLDPVPLSICMSSVLYIWAIFSTRMLTVIPVAKESIFDSMGEGFIVLDSSERLVDYNRTVSVMIPSLRQSMIGQQLDEVWLELTGESFPLKRDQDGSVDELTWTSDGVEKVYEVRSSILRHQNGEHAGSLLMLINVTELKRLQQELEHQAYYDGLTQILNRTQFIQLGRGMLEQSRELEMPFGVILFDIDFFKRVNDTYGHETGDRMIVHVVSVCKELLPEDALFGRYGGEEFVLALPFVTDQGAYAIAERLRAAMEHALLLTPKGSLTVTASFGIAHVTGHHDETLEMLLSKADEALYTSKRDGRNRVSLHKLYSKAGSAL